MATPVSAAAVRQFVDGLVAAGKPLTPTQRQGALTIIGNATGLTTAQRSSLINDILNIKPDTTTPNPTSTPSPTGNAPAGTPGAAAPGAGQIPTYHQPSFDPRMTSHVNPFGSGNESYSRGFMIWDTSAGTPGGNYNKDDPAYVNFLFNPSTISTSYQMADGSAQAALNYSNTTGGGGSNGPSGISQGLLIPIQQQCSFTLMFDRTYEMNDTSALGSIQGLAQYGVDVDIAALRQYTGMYADVYTSNADYFNFSSSTTANTGTPQTQVLGAQVNTALQHGPIGELSQGIMQMTIGYVRFGGLGSVFNNGEGVVNPGNFTSWGITYYGYIDSWSVEYTHFTQHMIPIRAVCDISFTFLPPPTTASDPASATNISKALAALAANQVPPTNNPGPVTTTIPAGTGR